MTTHPRIRGAFALILFLLCALALSACGTKDYAQETDDGAAVDDSILIIRTPDGTSANGNVPVVKDHDSFTMAIVVNDFPTSRELFVYIDGRLVDEERNNDDEITVDVSGDEMTPGKHTVEVIQYAGNDPSGTPTAYKSASYEVGK